MKVSFKKFWQPGFVDRRLGLTQGADLLFVVIDTDYVVATLRKAYAGDETNVTSSNDRDRHLSSRATNLTAS